MKWKCKIFYKIKELLKKINEIELRFIFQQKNPIQLPTQRTEHGEKRFTALRVRGVALHRHFRNARSASIATNFTVFIKVIWTVLGATTLCYCWCLLCRCLPYTNKLLIILLCLVPCITRDSFLFAILCRFYYIFIAFIRAQIHLHWTEIVSKIHCLN